MLSTAHITTPLHKAALLGDYKNYLELKKNTKFFTWLITPDFNGDLPLDRAAARGHWEIVKDLITMHKSSDDTDYNYDHTPHLYTALLSAVKWSFKVLDGTYNINGQHGVFNTGPTSAKDYKNIIRKLIRTYPDQVNHCDDQGCSPIYYAIHALGDAKEKANKKSSELAVQVIRVLLNHNASLENTGDKVRKNARMLAEQRNVLRELLAIESAVKQSQVSHDTLKNNKTVTTSEGMLAIPQVSDLKTPVTSINDNPITQTLDNPLTAEFKCVKRKAKKRIMESPEIELDDATRYAGLLVEKTVDTLENDSSSLHNVNADKKNAINPIKICDDVLNTFKKENNISGDTYVDIDALKSLCKNNKAIIEEMSVKTQKAFLRDLKNCLQYQTITSGFLFCRRVKKIITLDKLMLEAITEDLLGNKKSRKVKVN